MPIQIFCIKSFYLRYSHQAQALQLKQLSHKLLLAFNYLNNIKTHAFQVKTEAIGKFSLMLVIYSLIFFACFVIFFAFALAFAWYQ